jgi:signal transduction histidine kinase
VVVNLVANAIKFTEQGEIVVDVAMDLDDQSLMTWPAVSTDQDEPVRLHVSVKEHGYWDSRFETAQNF